MFMIGFMMKYGTSAFVNILMILARLPVKFDAHPNKGDKINGSKSEYYKENK